MEARDNNTVYLHVSMTYPSRYSEGSHRFQASKDEITLFFLPGIGLSGLCRQCRLLLNDWSHLLLVDRQDITTIRQSS